MKGSFIFSILISCQILSGQILCIKCYDQNDSISSGVHNLIKNGGFENNTCMKIYEDCFCPSSFFYSCDINDWKCTGGDNKTYTSMIDTTFSYVPEGNVAAYFGNWYSLPCSKYKNDTSCLKRTSCMVTNIPSGYPQSEPGYGDQFGVSLEQTITGLIKGNTYVLEFWAGGEFNDMFFKNSVFGVDVGFEYTFLECKSTPSNKGIGTRYIIEFKTNSSSHTIKFTNWGHICGECTELVIDDVRLYTLAELSKSVTPCATSTNNLDEDVSIELYPNPFSNQLIVKSNSSEQKEVILFDITSRKLLLKEFTNSVSINTEQLASGIYFYEVRNKNGVIKNGKVLKE